MPTLITILALLLSALGCLAQVAPSQQAILRQVAYQQGQASSSSLAPYLPGTPALFWYRATSVVTNGTSYCMTDLIGNAINNLTNNEAASSWPTKAYSDLNGFDVLSFTTSQFIKNFNITTTQPVEYFMVCKWNSAGGAAGNAPFFDGNGGARNAVFYDSGNNISYYAGSSVVGKPMAKQFWFVLNAAYNGIASVLLTNNVIVVTNTTSPGANNLSRLYVNEDFTETTGGRGIIKVAEFLGYPLLSSTDRSNVWYSLKTRYGL